jgi:AcrR family transcriptional regulator
MKKSNSATRDKRTQSASRKRRDQDRLDLRRRILKTAGEEFLKNGYESFSLRRVAERIGYTPTTIYLHFRDKDDLLLATVQEGFADFDARMEKTAASHREPLARIEALGRAYIEFGLENPALYRLMFMQRSDFYFMPRFVEAENGEEVPAPAKTTKARKTGNKKSADATASDSGERPRTVAMALLVAAIEEGIAAGVVKKSEPIIAADVLWAGAHGLVSLAISPLMSPQHAAKVIVPLLATLINGVRETSAPSPKKRVPAKAKARLQK